MRWHTVWFWNANGGDFYIEGIFTRKAEAEKFLEMMKASHRETPRAGAVLLKSVDEIADHFIERRLRIFVPHLTQIFGRVLDSSDLQDAALNAQKSRLREAGAEPREPPDMPT
jgi:hypothetical protein